MRDHTGKTKYLLLGTMARCPQTGYSIKKWIENEYSHFWQESFGQIYPALKELVKEGLVESWESQVSKGKKKQIFYKITEAGRGELKKWLLEAPTIEKLRYEILLKVSFGADTEPEAVLKHLGEFEKRNENLIHEMDDFIETFENLKIQGKDYTSSELTALCGKYLYTAMKNWAQEAQKIIINRKMIKNETKDS